METNGRMKEIRSRISPGMSIAALKEFLGPPMSVGREGGLPVPVTRSYTPPALYSHMAIFYYSNKGIPYFNVYVLVDESSGLVIRSDVVNLWW